MNAKELKEAVKRYNLEQRTWTWICLACKNTNSMFYKAACWTCGKAKGAVK